MSFGPVEILVVLFILAMIVGPSRLTRMARSLGRGAYDFIDELGSGKKGPEDGNEAPSELESGEKERGKDDRG